MRTIQGRTLKEIIKRDKRESKKGRGTYYRVNYTSYGYDPKFIAEIETKNKKYLFRRFCTYYNDYELIKHKNDKKKSYSADPVYEDKYG